MAPQECVGGNQKLSRIMAISRIVPMKKVPKCWRNRKVLREFDDVKGKSLRQLYTYLKVYGSVMYTTKMVNDSTICEWKVRRSVPPVPVMNIQSYDCTREVPPVPLMAIWSYDCTRAVLRSIYDINAVLG